MMGRLLASTTFYPLTLTYVGTAAVLMGASCGAFGLGVSLLLEGVLVVLMLLLGLWQETSKIATLTESALADLSDRVDQLTAALTAHGLPVPEHVRKRRS